MNSSISNSPDRQELFDNLAFLGEITASVTHELNNVLGTIEQVSGLAEDLAITERARSAGLDDRLADIAERIARQSERGSGLIKRLNRLAHLTDEPVMEFDLAELLENILALCERFANMRKVALRAAGFERKIMLETSPLLVTRAFYNVFRGVLAGSASNEALDVRLESADTEVMVEFDGHRGESPLDGMVLMSQADVLMVGLGGRLEITTGGGRNRVRLYLPITG
jgi:signal transduction histidine kinase